MRVDRFTTLKIFVFALLMTVQAHAQWGAPYSNNWIVYGKPYAKIVVSKKGIHKIPLGSLPTGFPVNQLEKLQLWHRGKQVAIVSTAGNEVTFYGVPNDGASDSLFYRPMSSRMNPYWSMYSDQSAYFLTVGDANGLRAEVSNLPADLSIQVLNYHRFTTTSIFQTEYSLSTATYLKPDFINSFFEIGASRTGALTQGGGRSVSYPIQLVNYVNTAEKPSVKLMVHGRNAGSRQFEIYFGKTEQSLRLVSKLNSNGFGGVEYAFSLMDADLDDAGKGVLSVKSVSTNVLDGFSTAYYKITYPQVYDLQSKASYEMGLPAGSSASSRLNLTNVPANVTFLDISDKSKPKVIQGVAGNLMVPRKVNTELTLLATNESVTVEPSKITSVSFAAPISVSADYIIITTEGLTDGANQYASYRSSNQGGGYNPLVVKILDIYNQFNYGEPSPVAIRRFVDYQTSGGINKQLLLIGKSTTYNERMVRELPDEVPTVGFPGSDNLLVEGLAGAIRNVPVIPVGRIPAVTNQQIQEYLQKVKEYEGNAAGDYSWRKNVLHLNGGKSVSEITSLKGTLATLVPEVTDGYVGGKVTPFVKQQGIAEVESVNITPEVNNGVGMITYFGHGSIAVTDLDFGYATDASRGYSNARRYPFMYFNGCGVGNIFSARNDANPTSQNRFALSMDWLLAANRGAIAIVANSFESYVAPSTTYLEELYKYMFVDSTTAKQTIGMIQTMVAKGIMAKSAGTFDVANLHQSILQGDPALRLVAVTKPDYAMDAIGGIRLFSESTDKKIAASSKLTVKLFLKNYGRFSKQDKLPVKVTYRYHDGRNEVRQEVAGFAHYDTLSLNIDNNTKLQRIEVQLDADNTISELDENNNYSELEIDWAVAGQVNSYPQGVEKDLVPPVMLVKFNDRVIKNGESIFQKPQIVISVTDDRYLAPDSTVVEVHARMCGTMTCDFKRVSYSSGVLKLVETADNHSVQVVFDGLVFADGEYEILVTAKDNAGNTSLTPYRITFVVKTGGSPQVTVVPSPNPATTYVRFETALSDKFVGGAASWTIYDVRGIKIKEGLVSELKGGINEWYWQVDSAPSGLYIYKIRLKGSEELEFRGKLVINR